VRAGIPIVLHQRSDFGTNPFAATAGFASYSGRALRMLDVLCAQSERDAERLAVLGADRETNQGHRHGEGMTCRKRIRTSGPKAGGDPALRAHRARASCADWGLPPGREEAILLDVYGRLRTREPGLKLVLVPRHAERREDVPGGPSGRAASP